MLLRPTETWPVYARDKWATSVARGFPVLVLSLALPVFQPRTTSSWLRAQGRIIFRSASGVRPAPVNENDPLIAFPCAWFG